MKKFFVTIFVLLLVGVLGYSCYRVLNMNTPSLNTQELTEEKNLKNTT